MKETIFNFNLGGLPNIFLIILFVGFLGSIFHPIENERFWTGIISLCLFIVLVIIHNIREDRKR